jgi:dTDP-4-dehydrorhamnose 3,5-epimerase
MIFEPLPLSGAFRVILEPISDERGSFARRFCAETFRDHGLESDFVQRSISFNRRAGTLRGLHFQAPPHLEVKLVRCTGGGIFDVMVDLRDRSPSYGRWHGEILTAGDCKMLYIPGGFAHGFQTLMDGTEVDYEISAAYVSGAERGVRFDDPGLAIPWPIPDPIVSGRDFALPATHQGIRL